MTICAYWAIEDIIIVIKFFKYDILNIYTFSNSTSNGKYKLNILNIHVLSLI